MTGHYLNHRWPCLRMYASLGVDELIKSWEIIYTYTLPKICTQKPTLFLPFCEVKVQIWLEEKFQTVDYVTQNRMYHNGIQSKMPDMYNIVSRMLSPRFGFSCALTFRWQLRILELPCGKTSRNRIPKWLKGYSGVHVCIVHSQNPSSGIRLVD